jgi:hypothetical protein
MLLELQMKLMTGWLLCLRPSTKLLHPSACLQHAHLNAKSANAPLPQFQRQRHVLKGLWPQRHIP